MERKRFMILGNLALAAAVAWCAGSRPAQACEASHRAGYSLSPVAAIHQTAPADGQQGDPNASGLVGLWQVTFTSGGQVVDQAFELWHSDGTEEILDITPPAQENACFGVWVQTGRNTVKLKHPSWTFDANGNLTGTAMLRETVTLEPGDNKFTGTCTLDYYDTSGKQTAHYTGDVQGTRITVD